MATDNKGEKTIKVDRSKVVPKYAPKVDAKGNQLAMPGDMVDFEFNEKAKHHNAGEVKSIHQNLAITLESKGVGKQLQKTDKDETK